WVMAMLRHSSPRMPSRPIIRARLCFRSSVGLEGVRGAALSFAASVVIAIDGRCRKWRHARKVPLSSKVIQTANRRHGKTNAAKFANRYFTDERRRTTVFRKPNSQLYFVPKNQGTQQGF
ncbi:MAG: hypothetical protein M3Y83_11905, partial [Actinomycetota bacterium]|nr:hypothetical protein [Actinomycetota bacterium]